MIKSNKIRPDSSESITFLPGKLPHEMSCNGLKNDKLFYDLAQGTRNGAKNLYKSWSYIFQ